MGRTTDGLLQVVEAADGRKTTPSSDVDYGVVVFTSGNLIIVSQVNVSSQRTRTPVGNTMEIVEPDKLDAYVLSMLGNGWTTNIKDIDEEDVPPEPE